MEFVYVPVEIQLEKDGEIYNRLLRMAEAEGSTLEKELSFFVRLGINNHLKGNLDLLEKR